MIIIGEGKCYIFPEPIQIEDIKDEQQNLIDIALVTNNRRIKMKNKRSKQKKDISYEFLPASALRQNPAEIKKLQQLLYDFVVKNFLPDKSIFLNKDLNIKTTFDNKEVRIEAKYTMV